jgi:hypothetical protein
MHIRRAFTVFLDVQSHASPAVAASTDWTLDWRWFCEPVGEAILPSERTLIDWPAWPRPRTARSLP